MPGKLRVIAGDAGGLRLESPPNARPTTDRAREALFSSLGDRVVFATVLDLFAGSGALAIEALSRGANIAVLVDADKAAQAACQKNLEAAAFSNRGRVVGDAIDPAWGQERYPEGPFDLVFLDPPYDMPDADVARLLETLADRRLGWLNESALVVVERRAPKWAPPESWSAFWQRKYGDTLISIVHLAP
jgi:16S rRNA (guanine966-N2)-methyltransferase